MTKNEVIYGPSIINIEIHLGVTILLKRERVPNHIDFLWWKEIKRREYNSQYPNNKGINFVGYNWPQWEDPNA